MATKLTLTIDKDIIEKAKKYSKLQGQSLSNIIENYLKAITGSQKYEDTGITSFVQEMKGSFRAPEDYEYKKSLPETLKKKYM